MKEMNEKQEKAKQSEGYKYTFIIYIIIGTLQQ